MDEPISRPPANVRLAFGAVLWRLFAILTVLGLLVLGVAIRRNFAQAPRGARVALLIWMTPRLLFLTFATAALMTVALDQFVRHGVARQVRRWVAPRREEDHEHAFDFHLDAGERREAALPARRIEGRRSVPGALVRTDRRLWFFPDDWRDEPRSVPLGRVRGVALEPAPRVAWGLVRGLPARVALTVDGEGGPGGRLVLAVAEPEEVAGWFGRPAAGGAPA